MKFRKSEWILIGYFTAIAGMSLAVHSRSENGTNPIAILLLIVLSLTSLACGERYWFPRFCSFARDWFPIYLTLVAFRELDWFTPLHYTAGLEQHWIKWDQLVLSQSGVSAIINRYGVVIPGCLELTYLLVYAVSPACITILYLTHQRKRADDWLFIYLAGTLMAYALVPFFPSRPPRILFPDGGLEPVHSALRRFNLFILNSSSIHSGVFPSAHVSSAFSAAWGLLMVLPARRRYGYVMALYACGVSVATVYGRYHYAVDTLAGFGISLVAGGLCMAWLIGDCSRNTNR